MRIPDRIRGMNRLGSIVSFALASPILLMTALFAQPRSAQDLQPLAVRFQLTDLDYKAIANAPVRVVVGSNGDWQAASAGHAGVTDAQGQFLFADAGLVEPCKHKRPTNFVDSLFSRAEPAHHVQAAVELDYAGHRWLYVVQLYRFARGGDMLFSGLDVYCRDASGRFTQQARFKDHSWFMSDLNGLALSGPGHEPWDFRLEPSSDTRSANAWILTLAFRRSPEPIRR